VGAAGGRDGEVLSRVQVVALGDGEAEIIRVSVPGDPGVKQGEMVRVEGMTAQAWEMDVLRALHRAQERARDAGGRPTFPELFEHDDNGHLVVDDYGGFVLRDVPRKELPPLPDFHALRHTAAMDCDDAEEARDLLRHRNSNVTRSIYRSHFDDRRRANLRARMEARTEATEAAESVAPSSGACAEVADLQRFRAAGASRKAPACSKRVWGL
jgi:hypothetical protein